MWPWLGPIPTYGVLYISGIISHFLAGYILARRLLLRRRVWIVASICYAFSMIIGAKMLYDLQHGQFDFRALLSIQHYKRGGLWGGLMAYFCLSVPLVLLLSRRKRAALDLVAMTIPIPWIFAKLGCLFNGCCYGKSCALPWAITFPETARGAPPGIPVHPTQIYEIIIMVVILVVFTIFRDDKWQGTRLLWFLIIYGIGRAVTELWRGDLVHQAHVGPLTLSQLICLVTAVVSIVMLCLWRFLFIRRTDRK